MQFNDLNFIRGPAIVIWGPAGARITAYSKGDIGVRINRESWDVQTSIHGAIDKRAKSLPVAEVSFTPAGNVDIIAALYPFTTAMIGKSVFPTTDETLVIHTVGGIKYTFGRSALTKQPPMKLSAQDTSFGEVSFLCLGKNNVDPATADAFLKVEAAAFADASFDETTIISPGYTAAYGASPYNAMESVDGFDVSFDTEIKQDSVDRFGVVGARLVSMTATVRFKPAGLTEAQLVTLLSLDGAGAVLPGQSLTKADTDLVISGTGLSVTIHKAGIQSQALAFGDGPRMGELAFVSRRTWTAGVANPLHTITVS